MVVEYAFLTTLYHLSRWKHNSRFPFFVLPMGFGVLSFRFVSWVSGSFGLAFGVILHTAPCVARSLTSTSMAQCCHNLLNDVQSALYTCATIEAYDSLWIIAFVFASCEMMPTHTEKPLGLIKSLIGREIDASNVDLQAV